MENIENRQKEIEEKFKKLGFTLTKNNDVVINYDDLSIDGEPSHLIGMHSMADIYKKRNHYCYIQFCKKHKNVYEDNEIIIGNGVKMTKELSEAIGEQINILL